MKAMRALNQDHVTVGWYQTASFDSFINATTVQVQYQHQVEIRNSVMLVHDPYRTAEGHLALRAYRLTDRFLEFYQKGQFSQLQCVFFTFSLISHSTVHALLRLLFFIAPDSKFAVPLRQFLTQLLECRHHLERCV